MIMKGNKMKKYLRGITDGLKRVVEKFNSIILLENLR